MSNELVVIEKEKALTVLSSKDGIEKLIDDVRERVMSMEGGNLDTVAGRKKIKSNAFKATKAKTAINEQYIEPLIKQVTAEIQPQLDTIQALKDNKKLLDSGLDKIRKDVNEEVTKIEDEIKRIEEEKRLAEEAEKLRQKVEADHEIALLLNEKFDRELEEKRKAEEEAERQRKEAEEKARIERERQIAEEARIKAEQEAKEREERLERERQEAIQREEQAKRDAIAAEERRKAQEEENERQRKLAEEKAKRDAKEAAERARQAEIQRQHEEQERQRKEKEQREANKRHIGLIRKAAKESLMALNIDEQTAKDIVMAIHNGQIANVKINY
jgi:DNA repair exonuclease SbcCD ATPase subunit